MRRSFYTLVFALFVSTGYAWANPLNDLEGRDALALPKGDGIVSLKSSFTRSTEFFVGSNRQSTFSDGSSHKYNDWVFAFQSAYGLTDELNLWLSIPIVYRKESIAYGASDAGMGDFRAGVRYLFWKSKSGATETAFDLNGKFPSGDTDIHYADPATGNRAELPLGGGYSEIEPTFTFRQRFLDRLSAVVQAAYAFRISALVEYLSTPTVNFTAGDGTVYALPIGNLRINWGDQVTLRGTVGYRFWERFRLEGGVTWLYQRPVTIHSFDLIQNGDTITSTPRTLQSSSSQLWIITPALSADLSKSWRLRAAADLPIMGKNWPVLPIVESAIGNTYSLEVICAF